MRPAGAAYRFKVPYGVREWLEEGDSLAAVVGELAALADRATGELESVNFPGHLDRLSNMERGGSGHPAD